MFSGRQARLPPQHWGDAPGAHNRYEWGCGTNTRRQCRYFVPGGSAWALWATAQMIFVENAKRSGSLLTILSQIPYRISLENVSCP